MLVALFRTFLRAGFNFGPPKIKILSWDEMEQRMSSCCLLLSPLTSGLRILLLDRAEPALLDRILLQVCIVVICLWERVAVCFSLHSHQGLEFSTHHTHLSSNCVTNIKTHACITRLVSCISPQAFIMHCSEYQFIWPTSL